MIIKHLFWVLRKPAGEGGEDGGGGTATIDRGDDFTPTGDDQGGDAPAAKAPPADDQGDDASKKDDPPADDGKKADDDKKPRAGPIPLARHKEILAKEREQRERLEQELANFKRGQAVAVTNEQITELETKLVAAETEYNKLLAAGELEKATAKMQEIRKTERLINDSRTDMRVQAAEARAYERVRFDAMVERLETAYNQLNPEHDDYDKDLAAEVVELRDAYQLKGYAPADALQKAAKALLGTATKRQEAAVSTDVKVDKDDVAAAKAKEMKKDAVARNTKTADKTPPATTKVGMDSDKAGGTLAAKDVMKMPFEQFSKLDEKTLADLRGDNY